MNKWDILSNMIILYDAIQTNILNILPTLKEIILTIIMYTVTYSHHCFVVGILYVSSKLGNLSLIQCFI